MRFWRFSSHMDRNLRRASVSPLPPPATKYAAKKKRIKRLDISTKNVPERNRKRRAKGPIHQGYLLKIALGDLCRARPLHRQQSAHRPEVDPFRPVGRFAPWRCKDRETYSTTQTEVRAKYTQQSRGVGGELRTEPQRGSRGARRRSSNGRGGPRQAGW